jgi:hypothetical protein
MGIFDQGFLQSLLLVLVTSVHSVAVVDNQHQSKQDQSSSYNPNES